MARLFNVGAISFNFGPKRLRKGLKSSAANFANSFLAAAEAAVGSEAILREGIGPWLVFS